MPLDWGMIGAMCAVSVGISGLISLFVSLMIRNAILEASNKITAEIHSVLSSHYVRRDIYDLEIKEIRSTLEWLSSEES